MLAEHDLIRRHANLLWSDDFVSDGTLEYAVLMDARLMGEGIAANNGLVPLHWDSRQPREHLSCGIEFFGTNVRVDPQCIATEVDRHHDLFQRGIASALADAVDG